MYIQITTRCNMTCVHCCFDCGSKGRDMSFQTFKRAIAHDDYVTIGGGEPTVHPEFWKFLAYAISQCEGVYCITNGKLKNDALALGRLIKKEVISGALSLDQYHGKISDEVVKYFKNIKAIRSVGAVIKAGRAKEGIERCCCDDIFVTPTGMVKQCGCADSPTIGTVKDFCVDEYGCWKEIGQQSQ